jgi:hypothetical protein
VLRSGGVLRFPEHTRAETPRLRAVRRLAAATMWPVLTGGRHTATDPVGVLGHAGLEAVEFRRLRLP